MTASDWVGRRTVSEETLTPAMLTGLRATLDVGTDARQAPLGAHWMLCQPKVAPGDLGEDGHPRLGLLLPPLEGARRMWAGSEVEFHAALRAGDQVQRTSVILAIREKSGSTGPLTFVEIEHVDRVDGTLAIRERQTIVYRHGGRAPMLAPPDSSIADDPWPAMRVLHPDPIVLFRYSALTFNGHRIHYDAPYATSTEGYPSLVVHAPLIATLMLDLAARSFEGHIVDFAFRGVAPAFAGEPLHIESVATDERRVAVRARTAAGRLVTVGRATLGPPEGAP